MSASDLFLCRGGIRIRMELSSDLADSAEFGSSFERSSYSESLFLRFLLRITFLQFLFRFSPIFSLFFSLSSFFFLLFSLIFSLSLLLILFLLSLFFSLSPFFLLFYFSLRAT